MRAHTLWIAGAATVAAVTLATCSGGNSTPTSPSPGGGGGGGASSVTITIGSGAIVSPKTVNLAAGGRVTFVNNDTRSHNMNSDPHPEHTSCPAINMGPLDPGQSRTSEVLSTARTCSYHDHGDAGNADLRGSIVIN